MQEKETKAHIANSQAIIAQAVITSSVPSKKSKEEAEQIVYINRV